MRMSRTAGDVRSAILLALCLSAASAALVQLPTAIRPDRRFRTEFFNLLNRANFDLPGGSSGAIIYAAVRDSEPPLSAGSRIIRTATTSRPIQFALKLLF